MSRKSATTPPRSSGSGSDSGNGSASGDGSPSGSCSASGSGSSGSSSAARSASVTAPPAPFVTNDEVLQAARRMFRDRETLQNTEADCSSDEGLLEAMRVEVARRTRHWHRSLNLTPREQIFAGRCIRHRFNRLEREILAALVLEKLALVKRSVSEFSEIIDFLHLPDHRVMTALRAMSAEGRLFRAGLIEYDDPDEDICRRTMVVDPVFVEEMLLGQGGATLGWPVKTEDGLLDYLSRLTRLMSKQSDAVDCFLRGFGNQADVFKASRRLDRQLREFRRTVDLHPAWKIAMVTKPFEVDFGIHRAMLIILLTLLGKELGHLDADDDLFKGGGLVRAATRKSEHFRSQFRLLKGDGPLVGPGLIQPCDGLGSHVENTPEGLREVEFELTETTRKALRAHRDHEESAWSGQTGHQAEKGRQHDSPAAGFAGPVGARPRSPPGP